MNARLRIFILSVFGLFLAGSWTGRLVGQTNEGRSFWFGFMEHYDTGNNTMVAMITTKTNTSGTISMPGQNWSQGFSVSANEVTIVKLPKSAENLGSESKSTRGIHVVSNEDISVYIHQYHSARSEATVVLPESSIGRNYYVMSYNGAVIRGEDHPSEFLIVGTADETSISITLNDQTKGGRIAGNRINIMLDAGETYQVQGRVGGSDLTGTLIQADKKIAVFGGNTWTEVPVNCAFRDNLLEQMYAIEAWGKKFVSVPNDKVSFDVFRILASEMNTKVTVESSGTTQTYMLDAGKFVEYRKFDPTYIEADKPVLVAQYNVGSSCSGHSLGDPSMVLLNSVQQTRDTVTLYNSSFEEITENFINVISQTADVESVIFDGRPAAELGITFQPVGANQRFSFARISVNAGAHTIISEGCGIIATAYGYGEVESYAYSGGAAFTNINANPIPEGGCLNDTIFFDTGLSPFRYDFDWDLGDGNSSNLGKFSHFYPSLGTYPVRLVLTDKCLGEVDTLLRDLRITLRQAVEASPGVTVCEGAPVTLSANDLPGARYEWQGPNQFFAEEQNLSFPSPRTNLTGSYEVIGIISGCATFPAFTDIEVLENPKPDLGPDTLFCAKRGLEFELSGGAFVSYQWQDNSGLPSYNVINPGTYALTVTDEFGCQGTDEVQLREQCPTNVYLPNAFSPNLDGVNDGFGIQGNDFLTIDLAVFDRWGNRVFRTRDPLSFWDGRFEGQDVPNGIYAWVVTYVGYREDGSQFEETISGSVALIR